TLMTIEMPIGYYLFFWLMVSIAFIWFGWLKPRLDRKAEQGEPKDTYEQPAYDQMALLLEDCRQRLAVIEHALNQPTEQPVHMIYLPLSAVPWAAESDGYEYDSEQFDLNPEWVNVEGIDQL
ncbi:MAG TPA: hypothetical protein VFN23_04785, partial [Ktedonobacteraceae bacterium]|nr:hypothetical protein [Ktedonobacteraceae bacterium]